jgi:hypothetical protein
LQLETVAINVVHSKLRQQLTQKAQILHCSQNRTLQEKTTKNQLMQFESALFSQPLLFYSQPENILTENTFSKKKSNLSAVPCQKALR